MRVPLSWLRSYADLPAALPATELAAALVRAGLEVERVESVGRDVSGVVVGEVLDVEELSGFKKPVWFVHVDVGQGPRGIVCGASNYAVGDRVPVALPGAVLPGGFTISARETYGRLSDGMMASGRELGLSDDHSGILVLDAGAPVGADAVEVLELRDDVLDIAVTPDRGYCLSVRGVAREAATACGVAFRDPGLVDVATASGSAYEVRVEDAVGCDRYVARAITGLDPTAPSPLWLRRRLALTGMRSISLAVDVTNHVLLDLGQPLHAFDRAKLAGPIVVRRARAGERITTLDGVDRALDPQDLVIADDTGPVALAGVMGGATAEIDAGTTEIVIESAHFDPVTVARTSRRHKLSSEASRRYERGVDDGLSAAAAETAVRLLVSLGGARDAGGVTDVDARRARSAITLPLDQPGRVAGRAYPAEVVRQRLVDVGCRVSGSDARLAAEPPSWRPDLVEPIDLVEEVLRLEGYDAIPAALPPAPAGRGLTRTQRQRRLVGRTLAAAGYVEVLSPPFVAPSMWDALGLASDDSRRQAVELLNPLTEAESQLQTTLLPGLLAALARNVGRGTPDVALYEVNPVFLPRPGSAAAPRPPLDRRPGADELAALDASLPDQPTHAAVALTGLREPGGWWGAGRAAEWADAVEAMRLVAARLGVPVVVEQGQQAPWHPGRCAALRVGAEIVGYAGELHPRVVAALGLPTRTCAGEVDLEPLLAAGVAVLEAPRVSAYPPAAQDVALVVDTAVPAGAVEAALRAGAGELLESIRLFDVYAGPQVGAGRTSLAYALRFRAPDRTLTVEEVTALRDQAVAEAARRTGAVLRG
ncbi:MAG: phenylalanine--tRNA ligase subunit beta [Mycobacteriales bacterium]